MSLSRMNNTNSNTNSTTRFLAVLIYEDSNGWRCEEPRVYVTSHPEIAYQLASSDGAEQRYGRRFLGLSHLEETTEDVEPISRSQKGNAHELVVGKESLLAFHDPNWQGIPHDERELREALTEPEYLMEIDGLDDIPWHTLTHAYGAASEVPKDIRRLTSSDAQYRESALWQLFGSIYHQGTLYPATAAVAPFILRILANTSLPDRGPISELLEALAESASVDPAQIEKNWKWRVESFGELYPLPASEMAAQEIATIQGVFRCLASHIELIQELAVDNDACVAKNAQAAIDHLKAAGGN